MLMMCVIRCDGSGWPHMSGNLLVRRSKNSIIPSRWRYTAPSTQDSVTLGCPAPPPARASITAAMDTRRLGYGVALPLALFEAAVPSYLTGTQWDALDED